MPFTGSHVAAVLPLARSPLVFSALVVGSMSPDTPYYLPVGVGGPTTHSLLGSLGVDALFGVLLLTIWHGLLARPALAVAPLAVRARVRTASLGLQVRNLRRAALIYLSLCVGAWTHIAWDAFTHPGKWGTNHVAWLHQAHSGTQGYQWAQYASGLVGAALIGLAVARWWRRTPAGEPELEVARPWIAWLALIGSGLLTAAIVVVTAPAGESTRRLGFDVVTRSIAASALVAVVLAACWHIAPRPAAKRVRR